ncbi:type II toxin-antitoxin system PemK/MazF family toxin [Alicyclobacillus dauci]|uniref:Type II toxin-antitoxin system PemK/MazF family toxin n=1 Tax=Alicyclobacillus dauci TaxID=1475485 RepID=A0ABY6Z5W7_9BACL|nr:type II toxin-antitoxin system PemK/MazF family toxin [Alicyclobacillus dauci]WAH38140.1 type II toxin-antitoxin system PemK/MazF family toxin [Alicyclobacillus dauci]
MSFINQDRLKAYAKAHGQKNVKQDQYVSDELDSTLHGEKDLLENKQIKKVVPHILFKDFWNTYGILGPLRDDDPKKRYSRGRKIYVDFGTGNIGKEASLPHPAFVLMNMAQTVIVVPTHSDEDAKAEAYSEEVKKATIWCPKDGVIFPKDTTINMYDIRSVSKHRVINDLKCDAEDYIMPDDAVKKLNQLSGEKDLFPYGVDLKTVLQLKVMELFAPGILKELKDLRNKSNQDD